MYETDRTVTPTPVNPLGIKGAGETGTIAATPTVVNAVVDALAALGVDHIETMPLTARAGVEDHPGRHARQGIRRGRHVSSRVRISRARRACKDALGLLGTARTTPRSSPGATASSP